MKQLIACCGINCENCDARIATITNDNDLREKTAKMWSEMFSADISVASINCTGCRIEGPKFNHCTTCEIRNCVTEKGFATCGDCEELDTCQKVSSILRHVPDAKENLIVARTE